MKFLTKSACFQSAVLTITKPFAEEVLVRIESTWTMLSAIEKVLKQQNAKLQRGKIS